MNLREAVARLRNRVLRSGKSARTALLLALAMIGGAMSLWRLSSGLFAASRRSLRSANPHFEYQVLPPDWFLLTPRVPSPTIAVGQARAGLNLHNLRQLHGTAPIRPANYSNGDLDSDRRDKIREMAIHAWAGYEKAAWGHDDLLPVTQKPHDWYNGMTMLNTPVDSLDTLFIMGLKDQYLRAKHLVLTKLSFSHMTQRISVFETTIRIIGGLLAAYDLDGDPEFLKKCVELADLLLPAFDTANGFPLNFLNLSSGVAFDYNGGFRGVGLAAIGSLQLEFQYLTDVTGNPKYAEKVRRISHASIATIDKKPQALYVYEQMQAVPQNVPGLFSDWFNTENLEPSGWSFQIGGMADSYYEYLLKVWLSTGDKKYFDYFKTAANELTSAKSIVEYMVAKSTDQSHVYIPVTDVTKGANGLLDVVHRSSFPHLACFSGGMFALGGVAAGEGPQFEKWFETGKQVTETCWQMYEKTQTGLGGDVVDGDSLIPMDGNYKLRPETVESLFYMWRFTHDPIYRHRGWEIAKALEKYCRGEVGFHGLNNVQSTDSQPIDKQESFFIAETLKYLFLLFSSDDVIPLEKYVFNTEAHPLSVRGHGRRSDPRKFVPLPPKYPVPVGTVGKVSAALEERRKIELASGNAQGSSFGVEE
ncbi:hypothetical protein HDU82_002201 [Entophlyctis luteolus]|nr:hypothetical protein HDU82_002201 [Entophlyctis luteolus]